MTSAIQKLANELDELRHLRRQTMVATIFALSEHPGDPLMAEAYMQASREYEALVEGERGPSSDLGPSGIGRKYSAPSASAPSTCCAPPSRVAHLRVVES